MECRARGPAAAAGYTAGPADLYKNLLVSDAILSLSLSLAVGAAAAALGGHKHHRPVQSPLGSQWRGHRRERGGGGGGGRVTRKERKKERRTRPRSAEQQQPPPEPGGTLRSSLPPTLVQLSPAGTWGKPRPGTPAAVRGSRVCPAGEDGAGGGGERGWERGGGGRKGRERGLLFLGGPDSCVAAGAAAAAPEVSLGKLVLGRGGGCSGLQEKASPSRLQQSPEYFNDPFKLLFLKFLPLLS